MYVHVHDGEIIHYTGLCQHPDCVDARLADDDDGTDNPNIILGSE